MKSKGYIGVGMEGIIARSYDKSARRNMLYLYRVWAQSISMKINDGMKVLEIGYGPGLLSIELAKLGNYKITGLDVSKTFFTIARKNARDNGLNIDFRTGNVASMPFEDEYFDFLICTSSFKNFSEPLNSINEMFRVLKLGGQGWISDLNKNISDETINNFVRDDMKMKGMGGYFTKYTFKHTLRPRAHSKEQFKEFFSKSRFKDYKIKENPVDIEIYFGK